MSSSGLKSPGASALQSFAAYLASTSLIFARLTASYPFEVTWSSENFGPDGPWNALQISVGGNDTDAFWDQQNNQADIQVYPGGQYTTWTLSREACQGEDSTCGIGGIWNPDEPFDTDVRFTPSWNEPTYNLSSGPATQYNNRAIAINGQVVFNASIVSVDSVNITGANRRSWGQSLGVLSLGIDAPAADNRAQQAQSWEINNTPNSPRVYGWQFSGWLFNQSKIESYSFGLHMGSAQYNYSGSLWFGGFDKGRTIGPGTSINSQSAKSFTLLDIEIGVENGGSPFNFTTQDGFLETGNSDTSLPVDMQPYAPYLALPGPTCEKIASVLPVTFDEDLGYYLWNVDDPQYTRIVGSPSWLNFVFAPAPGASDRVGIKVPFALLNLTLERPITTRETTYFPCVAYEPEGENRHALGRAFLQSAFWGQNFNTHTMFLAQAPGPGDNRDGLGKQPVDMDNGATSLEFFDDDTAFARSWQDHWNSLEDIDSGNTNNGNGNGNGGTSNVNGGSGDGLSSGAIAGIAVGAVVAGLLAIGAAFFLWRRRRRANQIHEAPATTGAGGGMYDEARAKITPYPPYQDSPAANGQAPNAGYPAEMESGYHPTYELAGNEHVAHPKP